MSMSVANVSPSSAEIGGVDHFARQFRWLSSERHSPFLEAIDAIGYGQRLRDVLFDDNQARAHLPNKWQRSVDIANDDRRQSERDFVTKQESRIGHERPSDGGHLLLAAGEDSAWAPAALGKNREKLINLAERPISGPLPRPGPDQEILLDSE